MTTVNVNASGRPSRTRLSSNQDDAALDTVSTNAIPFGARVILKGLKAVAMNGKVGTVMFWNEDGGGRYGVRLEDSGSNVRVKASNLKLAFSRSVPAKSDSANPSPEKNSEEWWDDIFSEFEAKYLRSTNVPPDLAVYDPALTKEIKRQTGSVDHCRDTLMGTIALGTRVILHGLKAAAMNGKVGTVMFWNEDGGGRYGVRLEDSGITVRVKASNLKLAFSRSVPARLDSANPSPEKNSVEWWEDIFSEFEEQIPAARMSRRKLSWLKLLEGIGMPHSIANSFIQDVTGDDDFEAKLRENIGQDQADILLAKLEKPRSERVETRSTKAQTNAENSRGTILWGTKAVLNLHLPRFDSTTIAKGRIDYKRLVPVKDGEGGYGQVFKAITPAGSFALKRQALDIGAGATSLALYLKKQRSRLQAVVRESQMYFSPALCKGSPNLALLYDIAIVTHPASGTCVCVPEPLLVFHWADAPNNTLRTWMKAHPISIKPNLPERLSLAIQMFTGLIHLHEDGIVHQDLKPRNMILFGPNKPPARLALTDFGMSVKYINGAEKEARCTVGTRVYMAPEQMMHKAARSPSRDLWAAGMVLVEMFGGIESAESMQEYRRKIQDCRLNELILLAGNIASAFERDAENSRGSNLHVIRRALVPLVSGCFQTGCEIEGAMMFPRHSRPTAAMCESTLKQAWQKLFPFSWSDYKKQIPQPKESPFTKYSYDFRASLYFELMEKVVFTMMKLRCKSLLSMVAPNEKAYVEHHIQWLEKVLEGTEDNRRSFVEKHLKKEWLRTAATQREDKTVICAPLPVPKKIITGHRFYTLIAIQPPPILVRFKSHWNEHAFLCDRVKQWLQTRENSHSRPACLCHGDTATVFPSIRLGHAYSLIWCGMGIPLQAEKEPARGGGGTALTLSSIRQLFMAESEKVVPVPPVIVICMKYGPERAAKQLVKFLNEKRFGTNTTVIWMKADIMVKYAAETLLKCLLSVVSEFSAAGTTQDEAMANADKIISRYRNRVQGWGMRHTGTKWTKPSPFTPLVTNDAHEMVQTKGLACLPRGLGQLQYIRAEVNQIFACDVWAVRKAMDGLLNSPSAACHVQILGELEDGCNRSRAVAWEVCCAAVRHFKVYIVSDVEDVPEEATQSHKQPTLLWIDLSEEFTECPMQQMTQALCKKIKSICRKLPSTCLLLTNGFAQTAQRQELVKCLKRGRKPKITFEFQNCFKLEKQTGIEGVTTSELHDELRIVVRPTQNSKPKKCPPVLWDCMKKPRAPHFLLLDRFGEGVAVRSTSAHPGIRSGIVVDKGEIHESKSQKSVNSTLVANAQRHLANLIPLDKMKDLRRKMQTNISDDSASSKQHLAELLQFSNKLSKQVNVLKEISVLEEHFESYMPKDDPSRLPVMAFLKKAKSLWRNTQTDCTDKPSYMSEILDGLEQIIQVLSSSNELRLSNQYRDVLDICKQTFEKMQTLLSPSERVASERLLTSIDSLIALAKDSDDNPFSVLEEQIRISYEEKVAQSSLMEQAETLLAEFSTVDAMNKQASNILRECSSVELDPKIINQRIRILEAAMNYATKNRLAESSELDKLDDLIVKIKTTLQLRTNVGNAASLPALRRAISSASQDGVCDKLLDTAKTVEDNLVLKHLNEILLAVTKSGQKSLQHVAAVYVDDDNSLLVRISVSDIVQLTALRDEVLQGRLDDRLHEVMGSNEIFVSKDHFAAVYESCVLRFDALTPRQRDVVARCLHADTTGIHVKGPPGSGKTFVAIDVMLTHLTCERPNKILFVCKTKSLAYFVTRWMILRLRRDAERMNALKNNLHVIFKEGKSWAKARIHTVTCNSKDSRVELRVCSAAKSYARIVIDEAHHIFSSVEAQQIIDLFLALSPKLLILSDHSQTRGHEIFYPGGLEDIELNQVVRSSRRIVSASLPFRLNSSTIPCYHNSEGPLLTPCIFSMDQSEKQSRPKMFARYASETVHAIEVLVSPCGGFPSLNLHNRLAIVVRDREFLLGLRDELKQKLTDAFSHRNFTLVDAEKASRKISWTSKNENWVKGTDEWLLFDTIDNLSGLERLFVIAVGLDTGRSGFLQSRCDIYRTVTRAHMSVVIVNEYLPSGWLEHLARIEKAPSTIPFDEKYEMSWHVEGRAEALVTDAIAEERSGDVPTAGPTSVEAANVIARTGEVMLKPQKSETITKFVRQVKLWSTVWSESSATKSCEFGVINTESNVELLRPPWIQTVHHVFQPLGDWPSGIHALKDLVQYGNSGHLFVRPPSTWITPIWYMFLRKPEGARAKGWFWTPYAENTVLEGGGDRWIPVSRNPAVPAGLGPWAGYPPAPVNADLITYLATTNIAPPELEPGLKQVPVIMTEEILAAGKFVKRFGDVEITLLCPPEYTTKVGNSILYCVPDIDTHV